MILSIHLHFPMVLEGCRICFVDHVGYNVVIVSFVSFLLWSMMEDYFNCMFACVLIWKLIHSPCLLTEHSYIKNNQVVETHLASLLSDA